MFYHRKHASKIGLGDFIVNLLGDGSGRCQAGAQGGFKPAVARPAAGKIKALYGRISSGLKEQGILGPLFESINGAQGMP